MTLETMIGSLTRQDQLIAMELLWRKITSEPESAFPPHWHEEILQERVRRVEDGEVELLDWELVKSLKQKPPE